MKSNLSTDKKNVWRLTGHAPEFFLMGQFCVQGVGQVEYLNSIQFLHSQIEWLRTTTCRPYSMTRIIFTKLEHYLYIRNLSVPLDL